MCQLLIENDDWDKPEQTAYYIFRAIEHGTRNYGKNQSINLHVSEEFKGMS